MRASVIEQLAVVRAEQAMLVSDAQRVAGAELVHAADVLALMVDRYEQRLAQIDCGERNAHALCMRIEAATVARITRAGSRTRSV